jgi:CRISPR-associated protein Cas2
MVRGTWSVCTIETEVTMSDRHWHLITYDVRDSKRLKKVAKKMEAYGTRVQYSVFRCRLDREALEKLHWELTKIMAQEDDLLVIPLCESCSSKVPRHSSGDCSDWVGPAQTYRVL